MLNSKSIRKIKRDVEAISPVVATLMLVLIAVAACTAFYLWESGWQASTTKNINSGSGPIPTEPRRKHDRQRLHDIRRT